MTPTESTVLSLLRASLHGLSAKLPADTDWDGVLAEANVHAVSALAAEGLPEDLSEVSGSAGAHYLVRWGGRGAVQGAAGEPSCFGNFGVKDNAGNHAQGVIINIRNEGLFPYLQRVGERDWVLYHRHRWLRPFAWLREGLVFFQKYVELRRKGKNVLYKLPHSSDRYEMLKKLGLY